MWERAITKEELIRKLKNSWCLTALYNKEGNMVDIFIMNPENSTAIDYQVKKIVTRGFKVSTFSVPEPECPLLPGEKG